MWLNDGLARGEGAWLAMRAERRAIRGDLREEGEKAGLSLVHASDVPARR